MPTIKLEPEIACIACGKGQHEVKQLVALSVGAESGFYLCDDCIDLFHEIIHEDDPATTQIQTL